MHELRRKKGTINISGDDPKDFEKDLIAHFAHVSVQIEQDIASGKLQQNKKFHQGTASSNRKQVGIRMEWIAAALNVF